MLRIESIVLIVSAWLIATMNGPWWTAAAAGRSWSEPANWLFIAGTYVSLVALHFTLLAPLSNRWSMRPMLSVVVIVSAAAAYYMRNFAVMLDPGMIRNIFKTDVAEAGDILSWSLLEFVILWSSLPVAFIWWVRVDLRPLLGSAVIRVASVLGALLVAVLAILPVNRDLTSLMRNQRELRRRGALVTQQ